MHVVSEAPEVVLKKLENVLKVIKINRNVSSWMQINNFTKQKLQNSWKYLMFQNMLLSVHIFVSEYTTNISNKLQILWGCCTRLWTYHVLKQLSFTGFDLKVMWLKDHEKLSSTTKLKRVTGKHLCWGLLLNKVAGWSPATILKWDSGTGIFCEFCLISQNIHLQNCCESCLCCFFLSFTFLFPMWRVARQWRPVIY